MQSPFNIYSMLMVFSHYCSGHYRSQKWSALYQCVESCSALLCLCLTFPFGLFGAWCLNNCLVPFFLYCLQKFSPWRPLVPPSAHSTQSVLGVDAEGKDSPFSRGYAPREDVLTLSCGQIGAWCPWCASAAHILCGAKAEAPYPWFALCWAQANKLGLLAGCVRSGLLLC